jgi:hypothetical protein
MDLELSKNGIINELRAFLTFLKDSGIVVKIGNTHGNTKYKKYGKFGGNIVFKEVMATRSDQVPDIEGVRVAGSVSLKEVYSTLGINIWFDTVIFDKGSPVLGHKMKITDNNHNLELYDLFDGTTPNVKCVFSGDKWQFDDHVMHHLIGLVNRLPCVYLIHPQFYK